MTPFDTEEEDPNGCEETSGALGPAGTLGTTRSPVQILNAAMETLSSMRTSGQNVAIRDAVLSMLKEVIQQIEKPSEHARQVPKQSPTGPQGVEGEGNQGNTQSNAGQQIKDLGSSSGRNGKHCRRIPGPQGAPRETPQGKGQNTGGTYDT